MMTAIINQLESAMLNGKPLFGKVEEEAVDLAHAMKGRLTQTPVAYVIEISRRPEQNVRDTGAALQRIKTTIGIVIGIAKRNDVTGSKANNEVKPILTETRKTLFGFAPTNEHSPLELAAADTVGVSDHALWKLERFTTEHYEQAIQ